MSDAFRPETFNEFVGNTKTTQILTILCEAAKRKGESRLDPILLQGGPGLGKTSLARCIQKTLGGGKLVEILGSSIQSAEDLTKHLLKLQPNDLMFCDEIHALKGDLPLFMALEEGRVSVVQNGYNDMLRSLGISGKTPTATMMDLPPFTFIGATTLSGLVSNPLRTRFTHILQLEMYCDVELQTIVLNAARKMQFAMSPEIAMEIAKRSRSTARIAIGNLRWFAEFCKGTGATPDMSAVHASFTLKDIDCGGLTRLDRTYLSVLVEAGVPVGVSTLASATGEDEGNLLQAVEPFLIRKGYVLKTGRGRVATQKAIDLVAAKDT